MLKGSGRAGDGLKLLVASSAVGGDTFILFRGCEKFILGGVLRSTSRDGISTFGLGNRSGKCGACAGL